MFCIVVISPSKLSIIMVFTGMELAIVVMSEDCQGIIIMILLAVIIRGY